MALRSYGPGKFSLEVDKYVYNLTLDGGCEEFGDVESFGHYCCIELGKDGLKDVAREAKAAGDKLTLEEARLIRKRYGAILFTNSQGFVDVTYYDTKKAFDKAWEKLSTEYRDFDDLDDRY